MDQPLKMQRISILSLKYAFAGIVEALKTEANLKFHFLAAFLVIITGAFLQLSLNDWAKVIMLIGLVLTLELTNTAIEVVINSFTTQQHQGAKLAKDISAGAVLIASLTAAIAGTMIFLPYITAFLKV